MEFGLFHENRFALETRLIVPLLQIGFRIQLQKFQKTQRPKIVGQTFAQFSKTLIENLLSRLIFFCSAIQKKRLLKKISVKVYFSK